MATLRQIQSNRRNSLRSTGAVTEAGRAASAANGRTHGLSGSTCLREDERKLVEERLAELELELKPEGTLQQIQVRIIAAASVRVERCELDEEAWRMSRATRGEFGWDLDRQTEAVELAQKIHLKPELIGLKLRQTLAGTKWLRNEFWVLGQLQCKAAGDGSPAPLDEQQRSRACDLLGLSAEARLVATRFDLPAGQGMGREEETSKALAAHQAAVIAGEIQTLGQLASGLSAIDASDRADAEAGLGPGIDRMIRLIRRYETEAHRHKENAFAELMRLQELAALQKREAFDRGVQAKLNRELTPEEEERMRGAADFRRPPEPEPQPSTEHRLRPAHHNAAAPSPAPPVPFSNVEEHPLLKAYPMAAAGTPVPPLPSSDIEDALRETASIVDPATLPISASPHLSRRARKAALKAARNQHSQRRA